MKNKIGWCDMTWNPVWGCLNNCEYCYARGIAKRFRNVIADKEYKWSRGRIFQGEIANRLRHFVPTMLFSHLYKKLPKKPQRIFVGSMSEIYYWKKEWMEKVIDRVKQCPQHTFQFLTKFPQVYYLYDFPKNCWLGITAVSMLDTIGEAKTKLGYINFISIEPLMGWIYVNYLKNYNWVIIGAETGNRKGKVIPEKEWVLDIIKYCVFNKIPYYLKDNLSEYYGVYRGYKQFPKESQ